MAAGRLTGAIMNLEKCFPPAQKMVILGFLYDAIAKLCKLSEEKKDKYITRIENILKSEYIKNKLLEKIVGNLTYAAWVSPFGRPFFVSFIEQNYLFKRKLDFCLKRNENCLGNIEDDFDRQSRIVL